MLSGMITAETINTVFRELSFKQRNGLLQLAYDSIQIKLAFQEGRIISVQRLGETPAVEICKRLQAAGFLSPKVAGAVGNSKVGLAQLSKLLAEKGYVTEEQFRCAKHAYERDILFSLRDMKTGSCEFSPKLVRPDAGLDLMLYPGVALIDLLEFSEEEERFQQIFGGWNGEMYVEQKEDPGSRLIPSEHRVYDLAAGVLPLDILSRSLLSVYEVQQALLALYDQELIRLRSSSEPSSELDPAFAGDPEEAAEKALELLREMREDEEEIKPQPAALPDAAPAEPEERAEALSDPPAAAQEACQVPEPSDAPAEPTGSAAVCRPAIGDDIGVIIVTILFLLACALLVPGLFETWFNALSGMASST